MEIGTERNINMEHHITEIWIGMAGAE